MTADVLKEQFVPRYLANGEYKFYHFLLTYALGKLVLVEQGHRNLSPDLEFLNYYDRFIVLYRQEGEEVHLELARLFRRAGHKIHRVMCKKQMTTPNVKFLNLVQL